MIFGLAITVGIIGHMISVVSPFSPTVKPDDFSKPTKSTKPTASKGGVWQSPKSAADSHDFSKPDSLLTDNNRKVIESLKKATPEEIQNTFYIVESLDNPHDIKYVLKSLDPGNLTKVLTNLPQGENETIAKALTEVCLTNNNADNEAKSINQLLLECKN